MPASPAILLVDDESLVRLVASMSLERRGYRVLVADGGTEGLRVFDVHNSDIALVISDIAMPDLDGPEMVAAMRLKHPHVKVLFISGHTVTLPPWAKDTCGLLMKPFLPSEFIARVEHCLGDAAATRPK
jgi:two-component system cell cycle sensor histidine kinase/response regulator CckA